MRGHLANRRVDPGTLHIDRLDVQARPTDGGVLDTHHDDAGHLEVTAVLVRAVPAPLRPDAVGGHRAGDKFGTEIRNTGEHRRPVRAHLVTAAERPVWVCRLLAVVILPEQRYEGLDV